MPFSRGQQSWDGTGENLYRSIRQRIGFLSVPTIRSLERTSIARRTLSLSLFTPTIRERQALSGLDAAPNAPHSTPLECINECRLFLFTFHSVRSGESRPGDRSYKDKGVDCAVYQSLYSAGAGRWGTCPFYKHWRFQSSALSTRLILKTSADRLRCSNRGKKISIAVVIHSHN